MNENEPEVKEIETGPELFRDLVVKMKHMLQLKRTEVYYIYNVKYFCNPFG